MVKDIDTERIKCNSRIPPQLEKNHVFPSSSQYEALAR